MATQPTVAEKRSLAKEKQPGWYTRLQVWGRKGRWRSFLGDLRGTGTAIINDCIDDNAKGRQGTRAGSILEGHVEYVRVAASNQLDARLNQIQAAGNLIDQLNAFEDRPGIILVNVAPRHKKDRAEGNENGTHFGYFRYKNVVVVSSLDGYTLSLVKKLGLTNSVRRLEIPETLQILAKKGLIAKSEIHSVANSQFRSFEYLPKIGAYLLKEKNIRSKEIDIQTINDAPDAIWYADGFGNYKTTLIPEEFGISSSASDEELRSQKNAKKGDVQPLASIQTTLGLLPLYRRLADVPPGEKPALTVGSSGIGSGEGRRRFIELVIQGKSAAEALKLRVGENIR